MKTDPDGIIISSTDSLVERDNSLMQIQKTDLISDCKKGLMNQNHYACIVNFIPVYLKIVLECAKRNRNVR